ncbi:MAG: hypothetical protein NKF70_14570 [Methanobacterium sp. ERen5]|nr:MAG: hypothetical protein NKF70_14570 [Methanobacterium sp. ERen5]
MKKNMIPIIVIIVIIALFAGAVSATNNTNGVSIQKVVQKNLIDSGSNKFYWGERGGLFTYTWKTYKTSNGVVLRVHYKTINNSWYSTYSITKLTSSKLKIVETSPEVKLYSGRSSVTSYAKTSLTPIKYYWKNVRPQIKSGGYFFA